MKKLSERAALNTPELVEARRLERLHRQKARDRLRWRGRPRSSKKPDKVLSDGAVL